MLRTIMALFCMLAVAYSTVSADQRAAQRSANNRYALVVLNLSVADKKHLLHDKFRLVTTVKAIPQDVQTSLSSEAGPGGIADAGQPYDGGDAGSIPRLPHHRLIFAAYDSEYCLIYFEQGGYGYSTDVILYRQSGHSATPVWHAFVNARTVMTFPQLKQWLRKTNS